MGRRGTPRALVDVRADISVSALLRASVAVREASNRVGLAERELEEAEADEQRVRGRTRAAEEAIRLAEEDLHGRRCDLEDAVLPEYVVRSSDG